MKRIIAFIVLYLQLCVSCNPAMAAGPFIWGADSRAQGLQSSGLFFSNGQPVDYNGPINKIGNNEAIVNTSGWATYADAAGTTPVDCTGGSPSITWTRSTSSPLRGSANFLETKGATNRQGDGVAYAFSIDNADVSKNLSISFDVKAGTNYAASDNAIYIYDVTNAALITPTTTSVGSTNYTFTSTFLATTSTSYRLCVHTASTNALAYTVQYDNFFVGPAVGTAASPTRWQQKTAAGPSGNATYPINFTGLTNGQVYRISATAYIDTQDVAGDFTYFSCRTNTAVPPSPLGTTIVSVGFQRQNAQGSSDNISRLGATQIFTSVGTNMVCDVGSTSGGTVSNMTVTMEELVNWTNVSIW